MKQPLKVLDVFAGPGGLAEGFAAVRRNGRRAYEIALSVEKDPAAFRTLRLRSFVRQFDRPPADYYDFMAGILTLEQLAALHPVEWEAAVTETVMLELATEGANAVIDPRVDSLRAGAADRAVMIGGPPCQAYSLAGRARNKGIADYVASADGRHFLYREYIRLIGRLRPVAFVMENVKGFLSSNVEGDMIFDRVLSDLAAEGPDHPGYVVVPLAPNGRSGSSRFIVESERFGVPQRRHRVILVGVRRDLVTDEGALATRMAESLVRRGTVTVREAIGSMAPLRSGISGGPDNPAKWRQASVDAIRTAANAALGSNAGALSEIAAALTRTADKIAGSNSTPPRISTGIAPVGDAGLAQWLTDPEMTSLPNHETRGHMRTDLARYAFAACYSMKFGSSPKARDFPPDLAPSHRNWDSGKFSDRFRVQCADEPATTITSHISKDGHYFIHPDPSQCRSLTVREAARLQTFPDNYMFLGNRTQQYVQVGNAVPPYLAFQIASAIHDVLEEILPQPESPDRPVLQRGRTSKPEKASAV